MQEYFIVTAKDFLHWVKRKKTRIKIGAEITELSIPQYGYFYLLSKSNQAKIETTENEAVTSRRQQVWWLV